MPKSRMPNPIADIGTRDPLEYAVGARIGEHRLRRRIRGLMERVSTALGDQHRLVLRLEAAMMDLSTRRERAHYDIAFEHGGVTGRASAHLTPDERATLDDVRAAILTHDLSNAARVRVLCATAAALMTPRKDGTP